MRTVHRPFAVLALLAASCIARPGAAQVTSTQTLVFPVFADSCVEDAQPATNFDGDTRLRADTIPMRISYLRFAVTGLAGRPVMSAKIRLGVSGPSSKGGTMHAISDNAWSASTVTWNTRPAVDGPGLTTLKAVALGTIVEFDVTPAVHGEGWYNFALDSTSDDGVSYNSSAAKTGQRPQLVVTTAAPSEPVVTIAQPSGGAVLFLDEPVTLEATVADDMDDALGHALAWTSSLQGPLGTGASLTTSLVEGSHTITASVTDSAGLHGFARVQVSVRQRPATNLPPVVDITAPSMDAMFPNAQPIVFGGTATDAEDGALTGRLEWTSSLDGRIGTGATFTRVLRPGTHRISARVTDSTALQASESIIVSVAPPGQIVIPAVADTYVSSASPKKKYGNATRVTGGATPDRAAYVRFNVSGLAPFSVSRAILRLTVQSKAADGSPTGGAVYGMSNTAWPESTTTFNNRPAVDGAQLATTGVVKAKQTVDFDVTAAVRGEGLVSFALMSPDADAAVYCSRENKTGKPQLIITPGTPSITLAGTFATPYQNSALYPESRVDGRGATFFASPTNRYPINLGGGGGVLWAGGAVRGLFDRGLSWDAMHTINNAAVAFDNGGFTVDGVRADNVTDGIRPQEGNAFTVRNVRLSYVRDDCIENDHLLGGLVDDSLLDGCYSAFSARPSQAIIDSGFTGASFVWTIQNSLVRLQPMPGPGSVTPDGFGHAGFFKWHKWDDPANSISPRVALHNNVFLAERVGDVGPDRMGVPPGKVASCSNNVIVWLGAGPFPGTLPAGCFTVTTDRRVWDTAVATWVARHPGVAP